jgi:hypothetical protein
VDFAPTPVNLVKEYHQMTAIHIIRNKARAVSRSQVSDRRGMKQEERGSYSRLLSSM